MWTSRYLSQWMRFGIGRTSTFTFHLSRLAWRSALDKRFYRVGWCSVSCKILNRSSRRSRRACLASDLRSLCLRRLSPRQSGHSCYVELSPPPGAPPPPLPPPPPKASRMRLKTPAELLLLPPPVEGALGVAVAAAAVEWSFKGA